MTQSAGLQRLQHQFYLFLARAALLVAAFGYAWLAWVDAPVDDLAVVLMGVGTLMALGCIGAAVAARQWALQPPPGADAAAARRERRTRRLALTLLLLAGLFTAAACCVTLPLRQAGTDDDDTQTSVRVAWPARTPLKPQPA